MEVPKAISVKPMMNSLTPSLPAKIEEKSINLSAENITTAKLIMKKIIVTSETNTYKFSCHGEVFYSN